MNDKKRFGVFQADRLGYIQNASNDKLIIATVLKKVIGTDHNEPDFWVEWFQETIFQMP